MPTNKSLGLNGLTVEFYRMFWDILGLDLVTVWADTDYKVIAKAISLRLGSMLADMVHPDQTYTVPGRTIFDNLYLVRDLLELGCRDGLSFALLSLDQEKAFNRVDHRFKKFDNTYLKKILIRGNQPQSSIVSLYKKMEIKQAIDMAENGMTSSAESTSSLQSYRNQTMHKLSSEEVESMRDMLTHSLYQVRQRTLSYNRHNLPTETSEKQAKEILIRRQNSLRQSVRKGNSFSWGKPASTQNLRFFTLPYGTHHTARRKARHDASTGDYSSDSDSMVSIMFSPQLRAGSLGANRRQQEMVLMERLDRREKLSDFADQRGTPSKQDHTARIRRPALMPKPQFDAVFEEEIQGYESEEEEGAVAASRPSVKWAAEKRNAFR
ncbi:unnamed protein product [Caretta caretta]